MSTALPRPQHRWFAYAYDKFLEPSGRKQMDPLRRFVAGGARGRVLEIGAGTGSNLPFYNWPQVEKLEVTEPDPFMLQRLESKIESLPSEARAKVRRQEAPAESLPFGDGDFDCAVVTLVLCSVADVRASLSELRRVLTPSGEMRLIEHVQADGRWATVQKYIQPVYGWVSGECRLSRRTEEAVRSAGFELEVTQRENLGGPLWPGFVGIARPLTSE
jgi:ubiquinone/menaquinone biosynthesis C-methylase UbiE